MAYPFQENKGLTREQAEVLRELNSFQQVSESAAWKAIVTKLQVLVDEAQEQLLGYVGGLEQRGVFALRWQQREAIRRELLNFMDGQLSARQQLLDEIKEQDEHSTTDTGSNDQ